MISKEELKNLRLWVQNVQGIIDRLSEEEEEEVDTEEVKRVNLEEIGDIFTDDNGVQTNVKQGEDRAKINVKTPNFSVDTIVTLHKGDSPSGY